MDPCLIAFSPSVLGVSGIDATSSVVDSLAEWRSRKPFGGALRVRSTASSYGGRPDGDHQGTRGSWRGCTSPGR